MLLLFAVSARAANLRDVADPSKIAAAFPAAAQLRVINVWATWCVPCVAEMPQLRALRAAFGPELSLVGVSMDHQIPEITRQRVVNFLVKQKISYPNLYYSGNIDDFMTFYRFEGEIPITIAFDRGGKELWRHQGPIDGKETIAELRKLLGRKQ